MSARNHLGSAAATAFTAALGLGLLLSLVNWSSQWMALAGGLAAMLPLLLYWAFTMRSIQRGFEQAESRMAVEAMSREAVWAVRGETLVREGKFEAAKAPRPRPWLLLSLPLLPLMVALIRLAGPAGGLVLVVGFVLLARVRVARLSERRLDLPLSALWGGSKTRR